MFSDLLIRLRNLFRRNAVERELDDELRFHFERQVDKYVQSGMTLAAARRRARLTIGGHDQIKEQYRDASGVRFLIYFRAVLHSYGPTSARITVRRYRFREFFHVLSSPTAIGAPDSFIRCKGRKQRRSCSGVWRMEMVAWRRSALGRKKNYAEWQAVHRDWRDAAEVRHGYQPKARNMAAARANAGRYYGSYTSFHGCIGAAEAGNYCKNSPSPIEDPGRAARSGISKNQRGLDIDCTRAVHGGLADPGRTARTHEIGVRMALGAQPNTVLCMVIREGMVLVGAGIVVGVVGALALGRVLQSLLFETKPADPATFVGVSIALTLAALCACYIPARRAMRVDPMVALRYA